MQAEQANGIAQRGALPGGLSALIRQAVAHSLWPLMLGLDYATLELYHAVGPRFDMAQLGSEVFRPSPRQVDLLLIGGVVNDKMARVVRRLWEAMACPRFVIAVGSGAVSGAPFGGSYSVGGGVDRVVPVDVYVPGDPPSPQAIIAAVELLSARIKRGEAG
jgi:NADH-quinone oxidoreductase subunit B